MLLTTKQGISVSGASLVIAAEPNDALERLDVDWMEEERAAAPARMLAALRVYVAEVRKTLDRVATRQTRFSWVTQGSAAPGDPPGRITGELRDSWKVGRRSWTRDRTVYTGRIESTHPAAGRLEWGDDPTNKGFVLHLSRRFKREVKEGIKPHPYIRPTLARIADRLERILTGGE